MRNQIRVGDKTLFRIDVSQTRSAVLYVLAADREDAIGMVDDLAEGVRMNAEWDDVKDDAYATRTTREPSDQTFVFTDRPTDGGYERWATIKEGTHAS